MVLLWMEVIQVGKTYSAIGTARELGLKIGIVCPKAVQESWKRVAENHFGMVPEFVVNYESLRTVIAKQSELGK